MDLEVDSGSGYEHACGFAGGSSDCRGTMLCSGFSYIDQYGSGSGYGYGSISGSGYLLNYGQGDGWCFGASDLYCTSGE